MPNYDEMSLNEIFKLDSTERIKTFNELILKLEKDPHNDTLYKDAMREAHSLKAAARIVSSKDVQDLSHKLEEVIDHVKQKKCLNADFIDLFFDILDAISVMVDAFVAGQGHSVDVKDLLIRLQDSLQGQFRSKSKSSTPISDIKEEDEKPKEEKVLEGHEPIRVETRQSLVADSTKRRITIEKAMVEKDTVDTTIRIGIEKLDKLINLSGEIYTHTLNLEKEKEKALRLKNNFSKMSGNFDAFKNCLKEESVDSRRLQDLVFKNQNDLENFGLTLTAYLKKIQQMSVSFGYLSAQLQSEVIRSRMLPVSTILDPHLRFVRDTSREAGKKIQLLIEGGETPVDRGILEAMKDPLAHLVRNACDHGIEKPDQRIGAGKKEEGSVRLSASLQADRIMIVIEDDGHGIDTEKIKQKAIKKNLLSEQRAAQLTNEEVLTFIYLPGFSTSDQITAISGRGVGLDVVKTNLAKINGQIFVETQLGKFTRFILSLPLTLAITKSLMVKAGQDAFCIPLTRVKEVYVVSSNDIKTVEGRATVDIRGEILPVVHLASLWQMKEEKSNSTKRQLVVIGSDQGSIALWVDQYLGEKEIVTKPLDQRLEHWQDISGTTTLDDGQVAFIVDTESVINSSAEYTGHRNINQVQQSKLAKRKRILVVEDSLTVRQLEKKVLQNSGYEVEVAVDGLEGFNKAKESKFDLIITDIEMPRMDGFELISLLKKDEKLKSIPTIIVSFKEREEDKRRGMDVGADKFIAKSKYDDEILLETVSKLIG